MFQRISGSVTARTLTHGVDRLLVRGLHLRGFQSRHHPTHLGPLHVLSARGSGPLPPLVVLHGFAAAAHYYDGVMLRMRPHTRKIIAPDLPGHGLSAIPKSGLDHAAMLRGLLEALDREVREPSIVFGNSLGAAAAIRYALHRRDRVRGLFLLAPGGAPMDEPTLAAFRDSFQLTTHARSLEFVDRLFARPHPMRHLLAAGTRHQFGRPHISGLMADIEPGDLLDPAEVAALRCPIHLVWGGADRVLLPSHLEFFRRHMPRHAHIEVVPEFGHTPHMDHPEAVHRRLLAFARECAQRQLPASRNALAAHGVR